MSIETSDPAAAMRPPPFILSPQLAAELIEVLALADSELGVEHDLHARIEVLAALVAPALSGQPNQPPPEEEDEMPSLLARAGVAEQAAPAQTGPAQLPSVERGLAYALTLLRLFCERPGEPPSARFSNAVTDFVEGLQDAVNVSLLEEARSVIDGWEAEGAFDS